MRMINRDPFNIEDRAKARRLTFWLGVVFWLHVAALLTAAALGAP